MEFLVQGEFPRNPNSAILSVRIDRVPVLVRFDIPLLLLLLLLSTQAVHDVLSMTLVQQTQRASL